jgi:hypothetical protein
MQEILYITKSNIMTVEKLFADDGAYEGNYNLDVCQLT